MRDRRGMLALSAAGILWGTLGLAVRLLQDAQLPTVVIAFWRLVLATAVLGVLVGPAGLREVRGQARRPWRLLAVGAGFAGYQVSYFIGVKEAGVAVATLVTLGIAPIAAVLVETVRDRRRPAPLTVVTVGAAVVGLALVSTATDPGAAPRPVLGLAASVLSGLSYTATAFVSAPLSRRLGPFPLTVASCGVALLLLAPFALVEGVAVPLTPGVLGGLLWLGLVTTALAYGLFYAGLRTTPGSVAMVLTLLEPATAVVLAAVVLGESTTVAGVVGSLLLIAAVAALYLVPVRATPAPTG